MIIVCPSCQARYKFDEGRLGERPKVKTKCAKCGGTIEIENPLVGAMTLPPEPEPEIEAELPDPAEAPSGDPISTQRSLQVEGAPNRVQGMKMLDESKPDLLILDVMMEEPDDGLRMARDIRKAGHVLPIIMLTSVNAAMGLNIDKDEEIVPVDEFQPKPVEPQTLIAKVQKLLAKES